MAKITGSGRSTGSKKPVAANKKVKSVDSPQRRKDPVFMKNLESAIADEYTKAPGVDAPSKAAKVVKATKAPQPTERTAAPVRTARKQSSAAATLSLADELTSLIPQLDAEGLAFLIEQTRVHLYNMRVTELESAAGEAERASSRAAKLRSSGKSSVGAPKSSKAGSGHDDGFSIKAASDGSAYDLVWQGKWKMFTGEEMLAMVRIASNTDPVGQVAGRLYRWFSAERSDVFQDIPFSGLADPKLKQLVTLLRNTFKVKGGKRA